MARAYNQRDLMASRRNFRHERQQSVVWLKGLDAPDWEKKYTRTQFEIKAGSLLASWLAHDFLYLRQLTTLHYAWVKQTSEPFSVEYAGDW